MDTGESRFHFEEDGKMCQEEPKWAVLLAWTIIGVGFGLATFIISGIWWWQR